MSPSPSRRKLHLFPPKDVAVELSLMDGELLRKISPDEIKNGAWMDKCKVPKAFPYSIICSSARYSKAFPYSIICSSARYSKAFP